MTDSLITNGKFYNSIVLQQGDKYSCVLRDRIEEIGKLCLDNLAQNKYAPIMMLGSIQSGKTRAFIGTMALAFDNGFDMTIILTKCSKALVNQTVKRMEAEFSGLKSANATAGDVIAQNILDIDFGGCRNMVAKEEKVRNFLEKYPGKKRILVVKKQKDNVERMNMLVKKLVANPRYKRILIVDDEADITSIGYQKQKGTESLSLRMISGAINTARQELNSDTQHVLLQVTATPYALYLQPEVFSIGDIMPVRPARTVVLPTGEGYIGAKYYFMDAVDVNSPEYPLASFLQHPVPEEEMLLLNGKRKNSGRGAANMDKRTLKPETFLETTGKKYPLPSLRSWIFDVLVGAAMLQLKEGNEEMYVSAVMHLAINKSQHELERELLEQGINRIREVLEADLQDSKVWGFVRESYDNLKESVKAYNVLQVPSFQQVKEAIACRDEYGNLSGLINAVEIKAVNSDEDVERMLNSNTGELRLENRLTIFVGGQVLDRGITIPNLINFFYGRDPQTMQQDTVMQHCRMFGYRSKELLSVTRIYTTQSLMDRMKDIAERDCKLRERMENNIAGGVVYLEAGGKIKACSRDKILASDIKSILPGKRYLPVGFEVVPGAGKQHREIATVLKQAGMLKADGSSTQKDYNKKRGVVPDESFCGFVDKDTALKLLRSCYAALAPKPDGHFNTIADMEGVYLFSVEEQSGVPVDKIAVLVRTGRKLSSLKNRNGVQVYQDAPDDGNNEGAIAQVLRSQYPVLVLTEQTHSDWKRSFWWPVYYTPERMNVGIYADERALTGVYENVCVAKALPMCISSFNLVANGLLTGDMETKLEAELLKIQAYHEQNFAYTKNDSNYAKRKEYECNIIVEEGPDEKEKERLARKVRKAMEAVMGTLEKNPLLAKLNNQIWTYLCRLSDFLVDGETDQLHDRILNELEALEKETIDAKIIKKQLQSLDPELRELFNTLGYFRPLGGGATEIHLYRNRIFALAADPEGQLAALAGVASHEMEHAWHYADVMSESGRWVYFRKAFLKQGWVQETIAEYFALCYAKQLKGKAKQVALSLVEGRDINQFPRDGGYSGALLIDPNRIPFKALYLQSLGDLPTAYDLYLSKYAQM